MKDRDQTPCASAHLSILWTAVRWLTLKEIKSVPRSNLADLARERVKTLIPVNFYKIKKT